MSLRCQIDFRSILPKTIGLILLLLLIAPPVADAQQAGVLDIPTVKTPITITTGGTFQTALPAVATNSAARRSMTIQNNNLAKACQAAGNCDVCYLYLGPIGSATLNNSLRLGAGQAYTRFYPYVPSDAVNVTCDTTGDFMYVDTQ